MQEYKLNWRFWFFFGLIGVVLYLGTRVVMALLCGEVLVEDGTPMGTIESTVLAVMFSVVLVVYLFSFINMLKLLICHGGCGLTITQKGIENTVVFINVLAFIFVFKVKLIPWEAVTFFDCEEKTPYIRVNTKLVKANIFAKILLKLFGYSFCYSFVKPKVTAEDLKPYEFRFSLKDK